MVGVRYVALLGRTQPFNSRSSRSTAGSSFGFGKSVNVSPSGFIVVLSEGAVIVAAVSGFVFSSTGDFFEHTFESDTDGQTFMYSCVTHKDCCEMQGSIRVGDGGDDDDDDDY